MGSLGFGGDEGGWVGAMHRVRGCLEVAASGFLHPSNVSPLLFFSFVHALFRSFSTCIASQLAPLLQPCTCFALLPTLLLVLFHSCV